MCKGIKTNHGISCSDCIEVGGDCGNHGPALRIEPNKTKTLHNPPRKPSVVFSKSPKPDKKMVAIFTYNDGRTKTTHFGAKGMSDYTIHKDPKRKKRYMTRHRKNENWDDYTSAGSLSRYILWGEPTLKASINSYLKRFGLMKSNPQSRLDGKEPFRDEIDEKIDYRQSLIDQGYEWYSIPDMPKHSIIYFPRAEIEKFILSIGAKSAKTNDKWDYFVPLGGNKKIREWKGKYQYNKETKQIEERPYHGDLSGWGTNPPSEELVAATKLAEKWQKKIGKKAEVVIGGSLVSGLWISKPGILPDLDIRFLSDRPKSIVKDVEEVTGLKLRKELQVGDYPSGSSTGYLIEGELDSDGITFDVEALVRNKAYVGWGRFYPQVLTEDELEQFVKDKKRLRDDKKAYKKMKEKMRSEVQKRVELGGLINPPGVIVKMPMLERAETKVNHIYRIQGSVFAAQLYTSSASATADQSNYKRICSENLVRISKANPSQIEVTRVERTNICHLKGQPLPETFPGTGSPYIKRDKKQTRSSDEPETLTWECELSGDTITLNPSSKTNILLTVPHAAESPTNPALHLTDYAAMPLANALSGRLKAEGKNAQMIVGEINRSFMDLNRSEATDSAFHQKINNKLAHTDILLDIHSYPTNHPEWGDAQVVLFTSSHYPDEVRKNTMNLANHLASSGIQVLIDGANHQNYIQNKGAANGVKQSDLIEVREDQDLLPIAEAIVEYLCGKPKKNPPEGSIVHALVLRFDLPQVLPFIILKERLEDYGFQVKSWRDKVTGGGGHLSMYLGDAMPRKKSKEDKEGRYVNDLVSIRFQENSQMVLLYGAKHLTEKEQEEIIQKVLNATQFKSNPSPAHAKTTKKTIYRPKSLTTSVSRLIMGDLLPQIKSQGKQDKGKQDKGKQEKKQGDQKNYFNTIKAFAKADGKTHQEIVEEAKNIGTIDTKEKATQFGEALGLDMSKLKLNPNVYAVPQRITGNDGIWVTEDGVDVTGQHFQGKITITGKPRPHIAILERPSSKYPEPKESGYRIRFNMLKPSRFKAKPKQSQYLISVETKGEHYYTKEASIETILTLATFPTKKSEPRLRPETFGELKLGKKIGTITPTGSKKVHSLYDMIEITPIRQNPIASNVKPTTTMFAHALGIPPKGMKTEDYHVLKSKVDRRMIKRNQEYYFDWELHLKPTGNLTQRKIKRLFPFLRRNEEVPSPKRIPYSIRGSREFYADKLASGVVVLKGTGSANRLLPNPLNAHGKEYLKDHKPMTEKQIKKIFKSEPLDGAVGTQKFLLQLSAKCQNYGEACGYAKDGRLYFKRGHPHLNEARVDGRMMANADAFFHTHPAAWEPSQTSPEDFIVYHGMFTNLGIQDHFTVIADRIDWFHFPKEEKFKAEEMAEVSQEFEKDIVSVFNAAENEFQEKNGNKPIQIVEQTRHINKTLCKAIPEYYAEYKCFEMSPVMILNSKVKKNPPLETYPLNTPYLEDIRPELYEEARMRFNFANELIPWGVRYVDRNDPRIQSKRKSKNTIKASIPVKDPTPLGKRFQEQGDKLDILRSFNAPKEFINAARNYLTGFSGRTSNAHIFLALTLYKEISDAHNVQDGMLNSLSPFIPSGGNGIHKIWLDDQALEDIISLIESDSTIENATAKHGKHAMALALHQIIDGILFSLTDMAEEKIISRWVEANDSND